MRNEESEPKINAKFIVGFLFSLILFRSLLIAATAMATKEEEQQEEEEDDDDAKRSNGRQWETGVKYYLKFC